MGQPRLLVIAERTIPFERIQDVRELCGSFAAFLGEPVEFAFVRPENLAAARIGVEPSPSDDPIERIEPPAALGAPMGSADFVYRADGRPDWSVMWESFCELALFGGPPHRGESDALEAPGAEAPYVDETARSPDFDAVDEIRRGIWETTGLFSEPDEPGWIAVSCSSRRMAAWLCAAIILENVDARFEEERLLVPASRAFELKNEVKSVVTVVAKTHHYWLAHVIEQEAAARR